MDFRHMSDAIHLSHTGLGTPASPSIEIDTGGNSAGTGGDGYFFGSLVNAPVVIYMPINIAIAGYNSTADAHQTNDVSVDQSVTQIAGIGGDGGNGNVSIGGSVTASGFSLGGDNSAE